MRKALTVGVSALALLTLGSGVASASDTHPWQRSYPNEATASGTFTYNDDQTVTVTGTLTSTSASGCYYVVEKMDIPWSKPTEFKWFYSAKQCGVGTTKVSISSWEGFFGPDFALCKNDDQHCSYNS